MIPAGLGPHVIELDGSGCSVHEVGGKAAGLDRLARDGFPIPRSMVISADAYRSAIRASGLDVFVKELTGAPLPGPDAIEAQIREIDAAFLRAHLPDDLEEEIAGALAEMLSGGPVAVRSSATAEDQAAASFAGQYRTFTRIETVEEGQRAVRRCWASLWLPAVRAYRVRYGISDDDLAMGVIVQEMIDADWSGVVFTRSPALGRRRLRIEAVAGLGEALVSGAVTPFDYTVDRTTLDVHAVGPATHLVFLEDLARMTIRAEELLDAPQDIEWAYGERGIVLLQARPITTAGAGDGFDGPAGSPDTFTPRGVVEMLPGVVPPLLWTINQPMLEHGFRQVFTDLGAPPPRADRRAVGRFRGRASLNLSLLSDMARAMPGGSASDVERAYLGRSLGDEESAADGGGIHVAAALRSRAAQRTIADEVNLLVDAAESIVDLEIDPRALSTRRLLAYRHHLRDLAWRGHAAEIGASSAAAGAYRALELLLERWIGPERAALWAQRITAGFLAEEALGARRVADIRRLVDAYRTDLPELAQALANLPVERARHRVLDLGTSGRDFVSEVDRLARNLGCRSVYGGATWEEDPDWMWEQLALVAGRDGEAPRSEPGFDDLVELLATEPRWRLIRVLTGQIVDVRIRWLRRQVAEAVRFLGLRERAKQALLTLGGEERRLHREMGSRLAASTVIQDPDDVELLSDQELVMALLGRLQFDVARLERRRRALEAWAEAGPLPEVFAGDPDLVEVARPGEDDHLRGWAASPGTARGSVRVIDSLADGRRLDPGDVLVAHSTDPSWTPLFLVAAAIVLEEGGPLSHAAIVAREFGLPAVLNVPYATAVLGDGTLVVVDGTAGTVTRIEEGDTP